MAEWHLVDLENQLTTQSWHVSQKSGDNGYDLSAVWTITRPDGFHALHLEFQGLDDMAVLPVEQSYACRVREREGLSLYFRKKGRLWKAELAEFVSELGSTKS